MSFYVRNAVLSLQLVCGNSVQKLPHFIAISFPSSEGADFWTGFFPYSWSSFFVSFWVEKAINSQIYQSCVWVFTTWHVIIMKSIHACKRCVKCGEIFRPRHLTKAECSEVWLSHLVFHHLRFCLSSQWCQCCHYPGVGEVRVFLSVWFSTFPSNQHYCSLCMLASTQICQMTGHYNPLCVISDDIPGCGRASQFLPARRFRHSKGEDEFHCEIMGNVVLWVTNGSALCDYISQHVKLFQINSSGVIFSSPGTSSEKERIFQSTATLHHLFILLPGFYMVERKEIKMRNRYMVIPWVCLVDVRLFSTAKTTMLRREDSEMKIHVEALRWCDKTIP